MCFNAGILDRVLRVVLGLGLIAFGLIAGNTILIIVGIIPLTTGVIGLCPLYSLLKINTGCTKE